jgi:hypothetical protein
VLTIARAAIGDAKVWGRFLAWSQPENYSLAKAGDTIFQDELGTERLNLVMLTRFWLEQLGYRRRPETRAELGEGPQGLIRWEIAPLFDRTRQSLENGGNQPARGRRPAARQHASLGTGVFRGLGGRRLVTSPPRGEVGAPEGAG